MKTGHVSGQMSVRNHIFGALGSASSRTPTSFARACVIRTEAGNRHETRGLFNGRLNVPALPEARPKTGADIRRDIRHAVRPGAAHPTTTIQEGR